mmetsp:Transcript_11447/g.70323  ORF Transcript_11447/g.70323 Transcript_11447/m.70323 type:complete len:659 (+) Transcript_11447:279-2255(+)
MDVAAKEDIGTILASTRAVDLLNNVDELHEACEAEGRRDKRKVGTRRKDKKTKLQEIFDVAIQHGIGCLVVNYAIDVCMDAHVISSDAEDAYLMDGEMLAEWVFDRMEKVGKEGGPNDAKRKGTVLSWLDAVLCALGADQVGGKDATNGGAGGKRSELKQKMGQAREKLQDMILYYRVLSWCKAKRLDRFRSTGRFSSLEEWKESIQRRRDKESGRDTISLFLDDLLGEYAEQGVYPPKDLEAAARLAFLDRPRVSPEHSMALWLYYMFDAEMLDTCKLDFAVAFSMRMEVVQEAHAAFLLDDEREDGLDKACQVLATSASENLSFKLIRVLASHGYNEEAFQLLMIRGIDEDYISTGTEGSLMESLVTVRVYLDCDLLPKAHFTARKLCSCVKDWTKRKHFVDSLTRLVVEHCKHHRKLDQFVKLPFNDEEELVACQYFEEHAGQKEGEFLIIFYMIRGRYPEAIAAGQRLPELIGNNWEPRAMSFRKSLLRSAAMFLTETQMNMQVTTDEALVDKDSDILEICPNDEDPMDTGMHPGQKFATSLNSTVGLSYTLRSRSFAGEDPPLFKPPVQVKSQQFKTNAPQEAHETSRRMSPMALASSMGTGRRIDKSMTQTPANIGKGTTPFKLLSAKRGARGLFTASPVTRQIFTDQRKHG